MGISPKTLAPCVLKTFLDIPPPAAESAIQEPIVLIKTTEQYPLSVHDAKFLADFPALCPGSLSSVPLPIHDAKFLADFPASRHPHR